MKQLFSRINILWLLIVLVAFALIQSAVAVGIITPLYQITLTTILLNIIYASGLNLVLGVAGQFSLGHAGFIAIGAYAAAIVNERIPGYAGLFIGMVSGCLLALMVALIVGIPTLRLKGDYLAIATLGVAEIIRVIIVNIESITHGASGITVFSTIGTWQLVFIFTVLSVIITLNYVNSSHGRATKAVNVDEIAAESMGIQTTRYKIYAFVIGAMTAAIGGALHAHVFGILQPQDFGFNKSIDVLIIVVFGGIGSFTGTICAAIVLGVLNMLLQDYSSVRMIIYALALILIMIFRPEGLLGRHELKLSHFIKFRQGKEA